MFIFLEGMVRAWPVDYIRREEKVNKNPVLPNPTTQTNKEAKRN
jgi:hypothetical protein